MAIAHRGYYPPAGSVEIVGNPHWAWNGHQWLLDGRPRGLPVGSPMRGKLGSSMSGWQYDWQHQAWMEPQTQMQPSAAASHFQRIPVQPAPAPAPIVIAHPVHHQEHRTHDSVWEKLKAHPWAPIIGGLMMVAPQFLDEPIPPTIPDNTPEPQQKAAEMTYERNKTRYERRMQTLENWGAVLVGVGATAAIVDGKKKAAA